MDTTLNRTRILHLDDNPYDAALVRALIEEAGQELSASVETVSTKEAYLSSLQSQTFDVILSDYRMPGYDGDAALRDARAICPNTPFIMVTGELGEERAIETLKAGATDYVMKENLKRLVSSITRALKDAARDRERRERETLLAKTHQELDAIVDGMGEGLIVVGPHGDILRRNARALSILGYSDGPEDSVALSDVASVIEVSILDGRPLPLEEWPIGKVFRGEQVKDLITIFHRRGSGVRKLLSFNGSLIRDEAGKPLYGILTFRDVTEHVQMQEALARSEERFRSVLSNSRDVIYRFNLQTEKFDYISPSAETLMGYSSEEFMLMDSATTRSLIHPDDWPGWCTAMAQLEETGLAEAEYRQRTKSGEYRWLSNRMFLTRDDQGKSIYRTGNIRDITESRHAEENLRLSEEKFAIAFANNPAIITLTRLDDGVYLDVNETWVELTGYRREEAIGYSARQMPIWPLEEDVARFVQELREKGFIRGWEQEFRKKSGERFVTQMSSQILTIHGEKVILSTMVDITERKVAEEALKASEENFRLMVTQAAEAMLILDSHGIIEAVSPLGAHLLGYEERELLGRSVSEFAVTFSRLELALALQELRKRAPRSIATSSRVKIKGGEIQVMSLTVRLVNLGTNAEKYFVTFSVLDLPSLG